MSYHYRQFPEYISVHERKVRATAHVEKQKKLGKLMRPVLPISGSQIAETFWGRAWCTHVEQFADMDNRLSRGRSYVRHGAVVDLVLEPGQAVAQVLGSALYKVEIRVRALRPRKWAALVKRCHGQIDTLVDLLGGQLSPAVMRLLTEPGGGILPESDEIDFSCSCPDFSVMCKHVSAVLYAIGSRLDIDQGHLFVLRQVDCTELVGQAAQGVAYLESANTTGLTDADLSGLFGIDLADADAPTPTPKAARACRAKGGVKSASGDEAKRVIKEIQRRGKKHQPLNSGANRDWLYAAAVRAFGSWAKAINAAGFDYVTIRKRGAPAAAEAGQERARKPKWTPERFAEMVRNEKRQW